MLPLHKCPATLQQLHTWLDYAQNHHPRTLLINCKLVLLWVPSLDYFIGAQRWMLLWLLFDCTHCCRGCIGCLERLDREKIPSSEIYWTIYTVYCLHTLVFITCTLSSGSALYSVQCDIGQWNAVKLYFSLHSGQLYCTVHGIYFTLNLLILYPVYNEYNACRV